MELSKRLKLIADKVDSVISIADIGTDHGYIPLFLLANNKCERVIAADINKDPLDKAKLNAILEGVDDNIDFRLGNGLSVLKKGEVQSVIIAGMGGNLIRDILEADIDKVDNLDYLILQPAQNPEVLREYLYTNEYEVLEEDLCSDEDKYYELFKVRRKQGENTQLDSIYYEVSPKLLMGKHALMKEYLEYKVDNYNKILGFITEQTIPANERREEINEKVAIISNMINFL